MDHKVLFVSITKVFPIIARKICNNFYYNCGCVQAWNLEDITTKLFSDMEPSLTWPFEKKKRNLNKLCF